MPTTLYLLRHGATAANLARPPRLLGCRLDPSLAPLGLRQAEAVRDALAAVPLRHVYTSPLARAVQTATIVAAPHGQTPESLDALIECDLGRWEGLDWPTIAAREPEAYRCFHEQPGQFGYPGGESLADVAARVTPLLDALLDRHEGKSVLVVAHHAVNRVWLAGLLGLALDQARQVALPNGSLALVVREGDVTTARLLPDVSRLREPPL